MVYCALRRFVLLLILFALSAEFCVRSRLWFNNDFVWERGLFRYKALRQVGDTRPLTTNNAGFFGDMLTVPKKDSVYRIFILGDSTVANPQIPDAIKKELETRCPGQTYEVNSTGVPRYTSYHAMLLATTYLPQWHPDCFVIYLGMNDNVFNTNPRAEEDPPVGLWQWSDLQGSVLAKMLWYYGVHKRFLSNPNFSSFPSVHFLEDHLRTIISYARKHGIDVLLVKPTAGYPTTDHALEEAIRAAEKPMRHFWGELPSAMKAFEAHRLTLQRIAEETDTPVVDAEGVLPKTSSVFRDLCHFTSEGNTRFGWFVGASIASSFHEKPVSDYTSQDKGKER